jgi:hypothetical protein
LLQAPVDGSDARVVHLGGYTDLIAGLDAFVANKK